MHLVPVCASKSDRRVISGHQTQPKRQFNISPGIINGIRRHNMETYGEVEV